MKYLEMIGYSIKIYDCINYSVDNTSYHPCYFSTYGANVIDDELATHKEAPIKSSARLKAEAYALKAFNDSKSKAGIRLQESKNFN